MFVEALTTPEALLGSNRERRNTKAKPDHRVSDVYGPSENVESLCSCANAP